MFQNISLDAFVADFFVVQLVGVLTANDDCVDTNRFAIVIFHSDLALAVGVHPWQCAIFTDFRHAAGQLVGIIDWHRHQGFGFIAGKTKHHTLITSTTSLDESLVIFNDFLQAVPIHAPGDVRALVG